MNMRLLGAKTIKDVVPEMVDASSLSSHFVMTPEDTLFNNTCKLFILWRLFAGRMINVVG